ncbi:hypothetical protein K505DRAFT_415597 [Melanomma pulvis-pyrius CBS 109.77]|uniref:F-box domain-containing protein n=1 Tax=Melanomma pulvis-pyrius CBS 109.77 TaxID=1314802 RepID=A0A6A6XJQ8_9PLEO|nr:hypothetical protein K505DRAFT_415597 [Melanomma pulvis-pyrius CBS 109.77]
MACGKRQFKKRARDEADDEVQAPATACPASAPPQPPAKRPRKEDIFPFLDLPRELQDLIYDAAIEITARSWPVIPNRALEKRSRKSTSFPSSSNSGDEPRPRPAFPFLGLTQTCTTIRVAFRGSWMENHRIPLCELERYLSVFHRHPPVKDRHRFQAYVNTAGQLKVWLRENELHCRDILRLLKLKLRLPDYTIIFEHGIDVKPNEARDLTKLVNNKNPEWLRWLRGRIITQVRTSCYGYVPELTIVVRVGHAPDWMRTTFGPPAQEGFVEKFGLDGLKHWNPQFAVFYG